MMMNVRMPMPIVRLSGRFGLECAGCCCHEDSGRNPGKTLFQNTRGTNLIAFQWLRRIHVIPQKEIEREFKQMR